MRFSTIIPTYNRGFTIKRAIDSILSQSIKDWELIVVDDGSTDNTEKIVKNFYDKRIKYFKFPKN
ncbi:MAG: glycosyltransferase, partial [Xanthomonadaceae bacterium]|nr:glycosyltransferase [Rhodospirillaceae bacterium]NIA17936.1 glycosyltransferase [Xanthomonadaceae bacterium]